MPHSESSLIPLNSFSFASQEVFDFIKKDSTTAVGNLLEETVSKDSNFDIKNVDNDAFNGPPMPYSKRKKFQNDKNRVYGQFPISSDEMHELRMLSQKQQLKSRSLEPKSVIKKLSSKKNISSVKSTWNGVNEVGSLFDSSFDFNFDSNQLTKEQLHQSTQQQNYESHNTSKQHNDNNVEDNHIFDYHSYDHQDDDGYQHHQDISVSYYDNQALGVDDPHHNSQYVIGPDGEQYYIETLDDTGDQYSQYETSGSYIDSDSITIGNDKNGIYPMFDLKFKSDNRTIDNTIESKFCNWILFFLLIYIPIHQFSYSQTEPKTMHFFHGRLLCAW